MRRLGGAPIVIRSWLVIRDVGTDLGQKSFDGQKSDLVGSSICVCLCRGPIILAPKLRPPVMISLMIEGGVRKSNHPHNSHLIVQKQFWPKFGILHFNLVETTNGDHKRLVQ